MNSVTWQRRRNLLTEELLVPDFSAFIKISARCCIQSLATSMRWNEKRVDYSRADGGLEVSINQMPMG